MPVQPTVPPTPVLAGVLLLVLVHTASLVAWLRSSERGRWSPLATAALLQLVVGGLVALLGLLQATATRPPMLVLLLVPSVLVGAFVLPSIAPFRGAIDRLSPTALYLPHAFRIIYGALLLVLATRGGLPWEFAEPVGVGDILAGLGAVIVFLLARSDSAWMRPAAWFWNVFGVLDFVQAVIIGFMAAPGPQRRLFTIPPTDALTMFPTSLIPTFAVVTLLVLHAWSVRSLLRQRTVRTPVAADRPSAVVA